MDEQSAEPCAGCKHLFMDDEGYEYLQYQWMACFVGEDIDDLLAQLDPTCGSFEAKGEQE